ncbi:hypothetical protein F9B82_08540 [Lacticaseibacillus casei]|nr:hypothetical protein F9B82_08540 [Lacticaseibacillus casei]
MFLWPISYKGLFTITRSPAQEPPCKDLGRNGQSPTITPKAAYTSTPKRAGSRSLKRKDRLWPNT